jgi:hypothetical protein
LAKRDNFYGGRTLEFTSFSPSVCCVNPWLCQLKNNTVNIANVVVLKIGFMGVSSKLIKINQN